MVAMACSVHTEGLLCLERQDLPCAYLAHHEPGSVHIIIIIVIVVIVIIINIVLFVVVIVIVVIVFTIMITPLHCVVNTVCMQVLLNVVHLQCKNPQPLSTGSL